MAVEPEYERGPLRKGTRNADVDGTLTPGHDNVAALNFRVSPRFKKDFKVAAAQNGITQSELLRRAFEAWLERGSSAGR